MFKNGNGKAPQKIENHEDRIALPALLQLIELNKQSEPDGDGLWSNKMRTLLCALRYGATPTTARSVVSVSAKQVHNWRLKDEFYDLAYLDAEKDGKQARAGIAVDVILYGLMNARKNVMEGFNARREDYDAAFRMAGTYLPEFQETSRQTVTSDTSVNVNVDIANLSIEDLSKMTRAERLQLKTRIQQENDETKALPARVQTEDW